MIFRTLLEVGIIHRSYERIWALTHKPSLELCIIHRSYERKSHDSNR